MAIRDVCICIVLCDDSEGKNFQPSKQGKSGKTAAMLVIPRSRICEEGFDIFILFTHFCIWKGRLVSEMFACWLGAFSFFLTYLGG